LLQRTKEKFLLNVRNGRRRNFFQTPAVSSELDSTMWKL
jgi:hypothetical protein